jgi:hypothetical protein
MLSLTNEAEQTVFINVCEYAETISELYSIQELVFKKFLSYVDYSLIIKSVTDLFAVVGDVS